MNRFKHEPTPDPVEIRPRLMFKDVKTGDYRILEKKFRITKWAEELTEEEIRTGLDFWNTIYAGRLVFNIEKSGKDQFYLVMTGGM